MGKGRLRDGKFGSRRAIRQASQPVTPRFSNSLIDYLLGALHHNGVGNNRAGLRLAKAALDSRGSLLGRDIFEERHRAATSVYQVYCPSNGDCVGPISYVAQYLICDTKNLKCQILQRALNPRRGRVFFCETEVIEKTRTLSLKRTVLAEIARMDAGTQNVALQRAVETGDMSQIVSPCGDAVKSYCRLNLKGTQVISDFYPPYDAEQGSLRNAS